MPRGRKLAPLVLSDEQRERLLAWTRSTSMPQRSVLRARIVLASAEGLTNTAVATRLGVSLPTVGKWRSRFVALGVQGLHDDARPGRTRTYDDEKVATVIDRALHAKPARSGTWSVRLMADAESVSKRTVQRWFALFGVKPHLAETFKLSSDPSFIEKVPDITGLYLNPPDPAIVLCVDEKTRIQALDRTQPGPATRPRLCRRLHARLCPPRHDDAVRRRPRGHGQGGRALPEAAPPSGVARLPAAD